MNWGKPQSSPTVVPVTGPQGLQQWDLGVPDLGGGAYVAMASQIMKSMDKSAENVGSLLMQRQGASYLLGTMANAKVPGTGQPMFDPEMMNKLAKGPLAAQQQFLGTALSTYANAQNQAAEQTGQMRMLQQYMNNPRLLQGHALMSGRPIAVADSGTGSGGIQTTTNNPAPVQQQSSDIQPEKPKGPMYNPPPGYQVSTQSIGNNSYHTMHDPSGKIVQIYDSDWNIVNPSTNARVAPTPP